MRERSTQVSPQKGQMLSLKPPPSGDRTGAPARVVYGEDCYIIPRNDRVVVGATVENSSTMHCDVEGVHSLLGRAQKLCPGLGAWQLDDAWAGLRPTTTDGAPVRARRPVVLWWFHFVDVTRGHLTMTWVVCFSI